MTHKDIYDLMAIALFIPFPVALAWWLFHGGNWWNSR